MAALRLSLTASLSTCDEIHEALITDVVVAMAREFGVRLAGWGSLQLHIIVRLLVSYRFVRQGVADDDS